MKKSVITQFLALLLVVLATSMARAASYYVAPSGDDSRSPAEASNSGTPWLTIARAITGAQAGDTIRILSGTYPEAVTVNKSLTLMGEGATKPILTGDAVLNAVIVVQAPNVHIHGLRLAVNQAGTLFGIRNQGTAVSGLVIEDNEIVGTSNGGGALCSQFGSMGINLSNIGTSTYIIRRNYVGPANDQSCAFGRAIRVNQGGAGVIGGPVLADSNLLVAVYGVQVGSARGPVTIANNHAYGIGVQFVGSAANSGNHVISNNLFNAGIPYLIAVLLEIRDNSRAGSTLTVRNNLFQNYSFNGIISARSNNVSVLDNTFQPRDTTTYTHIQVNTKQLTGGTAATQTPVVNGITIQGNNFGGGTIAGAGTGIFFANHNSNSSFGTVTVGGAGALANNFSGSLGRYIVLDSSAGPSVQFPYFSGENVNSITNMAPVNVAINASENNFDGQLPATMGAAQLFALENKLQHAVDYSALGFVTVVPGAAYVTPESFLAPRTSSANIQRAVDVVAMGGQVSVAPGTYANNVNINRSVSVVGTSLGRPVVNGDAAAGVFTVSAPNVTISGLTISVSQATAQYGVTTSGTNVNNLFITDNQILSAGNAGGAACNIFGSMGIYLNNIGNSSYNISRNIIFPATATSCSFGRGVRVFQGGVATIGGAVLSDSNLIGAFYSIQVGDPRGAVQIQNNHLYGIGVQLVAPGANSGNHLIADNRLDAGVPYVIAQLVEIRDVTRAGSSVEVRGNNFTNYSYFGINSQRSNNVSVLNNVFTPRDTTTYVHIGVNTKQVTAATAASQTAFVNGISIQGNTFNAGTIAGAGVGVWFANHNNTGSFAPITLSGNSFAAGLGRYIALDSASGPSLLNALYTGENPNSSTNMAPANVAVNAADNTFDGVMPANMSAAELFALENKIQHGVDFSSLGFVTVVPGQAYVTQQSFLAPRTTAGSIQRGVDVAPLNGTVNVAPGTFTENVSVNRSVSVAGTSLGRPVVNGDAAEAVFAVSAPNVTLAGLSIRVSQATALYGIRSTVNTVDGLTIRNNEIFSTAAGVNCFQFGTMGMFLENMGSSRFSITGNIVRPLTLDGNTCAFGRAIRSSGGHGTIGGAGADSNQFIASNTMQILSSNGGPVTIENNSIYGLGIQFNSPANNSGAHRIVGNRFDPIVPYAVPFLCEIRNVSGTGNSVAVEGNTFNRFAHYGVFSGRSTNVSVLNNVFNPHDTASFIAIGVNTKQLTNGNASSQTSRVNSISINGNTINAAATVNGGIGVGFYNYNSNSSFANVTVGNTAANNFSSRLNYYLYQDTATGFSRQYYPFGVEDINATTPVAAANVNVDFSNNSVDGVSISSMNLTQRYAVSDKVLDAIDFADLGYASLAANAAYVSNNAFLPGRTTAPSLARAAVVAPEGATVFHSGNNYADALTITKNLTFDADGNQSVALGNVEMNGAGRTLTLADNYSAAGLTLTAGNVDPLANTFTVNTNIIGGSATSFVKADVGRLARAGVGAGTTVFPVGFGTGYYPLTVNDNNNTNDTWTVGLAARSSAGSFLPVLPPSAERFVNAQWLFTEATPGGSDATVSAAWPAGAVVGGALSATQSYLGVLQAAGWQALNATLGTGVASASGVASSRGFAVWSENIPTGVVYYLADTGDDARSNAQARVRTTPWRTFGNAIPRIVDGDTIIVLSGTFPENPIINKQIAIIGDLSNMTNKPVVNGNTRTAVFTVQARNVTIQNLQIEVDQATTTEGIGTTGVNVNINNIKILDNNIFSTFDGSISASIFASYGIRLQDVNRSGFTIARNQIRPRTPANTLFGRGIRTVGGWGTIGGLVAADSNSINGIYSVQSGDNNGGPLVVSHNRLRQLGIEVNTPATNSGGARLSHNYIDALLGTTPIAGIEIKNARNAGAQVSVDSNTIVNFGLYGIFSSHSNNVRLVGNTLTPRATALAPRAVGVNTKMQTNALDPGNVVSQLEMYGNHLHGNGNPRSTGIEFANHDNRSTVGASIIGGTGANANVFYADLGRFVVQDTFTGITNTHPFWSAAVTGTVTIANTARRPQDISANLFELSTGTKAPTAMTIAELMEVEAKLAHATTYDSLGFLTVVPNTAYVSNQSFIAPYTSTPSVQRGMNAVTSYTADATVITEANAYAEDVVGRNVTLTTANDNSLNLRSITMSNAADTLSLAVRTVVDNALNLNAGYVAAQGGNVVIPAAGNLTGGNNSSYVLTNATNGLVRHDLSATAKSFAVGAPGIGYLPVSVADANNTGDSLQVRVRAATAAAQFTGGLPATAVRFVPAEWNLTKGTSGGANATVTFGWPAGSVVGTGVLGNGTVVGNYDGTNWQERNATLGVNSASSSGFTSFSPFAVYDNNISAGVRYYVDATRGDDARSNSAATNPNTPWRTITNATNRTLDGDTVVVFSGNYNELPVIRRQTAYIGGVFDAGNVILPPSAQALANKPVVTGAGDSQDSSSVFKVWAPRVTIQNFNIQVNQATTMNGIWANNTRIDSLRIEDNLITGTAVGANVGLIFRSNAIALKGNLANNYVRVRGNTVTLNSFTTGQAFGRAIRMEGAYGYIGGTTPADSNRFIAYYGVDAVSTKGGPVRIVGNALTAYGVSLGFSEANAGQHEVRRNRIDQLAPGLVLASVEIRNMLAAGTSVLVDSNVFLNHSNIGVFSTRSRNVTVSNNTFIAADTARSFAHVVVNTKMRTAGTAASQNAQVNSITLTGNNFAGASTVKGSGIVFQNSNANGSFDNVVIGGAGAAANSFGANLRNFIVQDTSASFSAFNPVFAGELPTAITQQAPAVVNANVGENMFGTSAGMVRGSAAATAQQYEIEDKLQHGIDYASLGLLTVVPGNAFVTANSFVAPLTTAASFQRAHDKLAAGDTVNSAALAPETFTVSKSLALRSTSATSRATVNTLVMNAPGESLTVLGNVAVANNLTFNAGGGRVLLGSGNLNLAATAGITGGDAQAYVATTGAGRLTHAALPAATVTFPVGTAADYAPVTITDANNSGDSVAIGVAAAATANAFTPQLPSNALRFPRLQWFVGGANRGVNNASITLAWPAASVSNPPLSATNTVIAQGDAFAWNPLSATLGVEQATVNGLSSVNSSYAVYSTDQLSGTKYFVDSLTGDDSRANVVAQVRTTPWRTITNALNRVVDGDTIVVLTDGTYGYRENLVVDKQIILIGNDLTPAIKPVINGINAPAVITVANRNILIQNFEIRVNQSTTTRGIRATAGNVNNLRILDNRIITDNTLRSVAGTVFDSYGILLDLGSSSTNEFTIARNVITYRSDAAAIFGRGIRTIGGFGRIGGSTAADSNQVIGVYSLQLANTRGGNLLVRNNHLYLQGLEINTPSVGNHLITRNKFEAAAPAFAFALAEVKSNVVPGAVISLDSNEFLGHSGFGVFSSRSNNVNVTNNIFAPADTARGFTHIHVNTKQRTAAVNEPAFVNGATITGNVFLGAGRQSGVGIALANHNNSSSFGTVTVGGAGAAANLFADSLSRYILMDASTGATSTNALWTSAPGTIMSPANVDINAAGNLFGNGTAGVSLPAGMSRSELFYVENKFQHKLGLTDLGLVTVTPGTVYVSNNSFVAPLTTAPSIQRAVTASAANGTVLIRPAAVAENVVVDKSLTFEAEVTANSVNVSGLTMNGAGATLTLNSPVRASNSLNLTNGLVALTNHNLTVSAAGTISGGSDASYVVTPGTTQLVKEGVSDAAVTFPVGTAVAYAPVTFDDANNTGDGIAVNVAGPRTAATFSTPLPAAASNSYVSNEYTITEGTTGGSNATLTFGWNSQLSEVNPPLTPNTKVLRLQGGNWVTFNSTYNAVSGTQSSADGSFSQFGRFAVVRDNSPVALATEVRNANGVLTNSFCPGDSVYVVAQTTDVYNAANVFTAELSDATGSFATPTILGTVAATGRDTIRTVIPVGTALGTAYRIRVVASDPFFIGLDNGSEITIGNTPAKPQLNLTTGAFCTGDSIQLSAPAGFTSYLWSNGATAQNIFVRTAGSYTVVVANGACASVPSDAAVITENPRPDATFTGAPATICATSTVTLVPATAGGTFFVNGVAQVGNTFALTTVGNARIVYRATSAAGCVDSTVATVVVNALPNATFTGLNAAVCVNAGPITMTPATAGGTFFQNGVALPGNVFTPTTPGTFRIRYSVTNADNCTDTTGITVVVNPLPVATFTGLANTYCAGAAAVTMTPATAGGTFFQNGVALPGNVFNPTTAGTFRIRYSVTVAGCTDTTGVTVVVNPLPVATFTASATAACIGDPAITLTPTVGGGTFSGTGVTGNTFSPTAAGAFTITYTVTVNGCTNSTQQTINVSARPDANFTASAAAICAGETITFTAVTAGGTYALNGVTFAGNSTTIAAAGTYRVRYSVTNAGGCTDTTGQTIVVNPRPVASFTAPADVCGGVQVSPVPTTAGGTFFVNNVATAVPFNAPVIGTSFSLKYVVRNATGCADSTETVVTINPAPNVNFTAPAASCAGTTITFTPDVAGGTFNVNGSDITGNTFTPTAAGTYVVTYTNTSAQGCQLTSAPFTITVGTPNLGLAVANDTVNAVPGDAVTLTATATAAGGTFTWTGPGVNVTGASLNLTDVQETATYTVTYTLNGCTESRTVVVRVNRSIFIPNLFSPNGDGANDKLFIYGYNISSEDFSFTVFNRYGNQVYSTTNPSDVCFHLNPNGGWNGGSLPTDVYNYVLRGKLTNGTELKVEGRNTGSVYLQK